MTLISACHDPYKFCFYCSATHVTLQVLQAKPVNKWYRGSHAVFSVYNACYNVCPFRCLLLVAQQAFGEMLKKIARLARYEFLKSESKLVLNKLISYNIMVTLMLDLEPSVLKNPNFTSLLNYKQEKTILLCKGKYHCTADLVCCNLTQPCEAKGSGDTSLMKGGTICLNID